MRRNLSTISFKALKELQVWFASVTVGISRTLDVAMNVFVMLRRSIWAPPADKIAAFCPISFPHLSYCGIETLKAFPGLPWYIAMVVKDCGGRKLWERSKLTDDFLLECAREDLDFSRFSAVPKSTDIYYQYRYHTNLTKLEILVCFFYYFCHIHFTFSKRYCVAMILPCLLF